MDTAFATAPARHRRVTAAVAREHQGVYDDGQREQPDQREAPSPRPERAEGGAPFGLPILAELPELAGVLGAIDRADRELREAVLGLVQLRASDAVAMATGVDLDHWLAAVAGATRLDRGLLRRACRLLERLPALRAALADGRVTFAQLRALTLRLADAPRDLDEQLDRWLGAAIDQLPADADPDVLVRQAGKAVDELAPELLAEEQEDTQHYLRSLTIQPNLFGTGGTYHGTEDALGLAILEAATAPRPDQRHLAVARARANNLQMLLRNHPAIAGDDGAAGADAPDDEASDGPVPIGRLPAPKLVLRCELDSLLGRNALPAQLLTRLFGGRLLVTSELARQLLDERGAELRTVIVDQGRVLGVGTATHVPPGWMRDALLAIFDTCTGPICEKPALGAHADHAVPRHPVGDQAAAGPTNLDNIGPLCPETNVAKEKAGWKVSQTLVGQRRWHHPRSGITITTVPATWRPRGLPPPTPPKPPPRGDPPHVSDGGTDARATDHRVIGDGATDDRATDGDATDDALPF